MYSSKQLYKGPTTLYNPRWFDVGNDLAGSDKTKAIRFDANPDLVAEFDTLVENRSAGLRRLMREYVDREGSKVSRRPLHPPTDGDLADTYETLVRLARPGIWVRQKRAKSAVVGGNISEEDFKFLLTQLEYRGYIRRATDWDGRYAAIRVRFRKPDQTETSASREATASAD